MFNKENDYWFFKNEVLLDRRFIYSERSKEFISNLRKMLVSNAVEISNKTRLNRAQKGCLFRDQKDDNGEVYHQAECCYPRKRMIPLREKAKEGRANPKGIPYLYLASNTSTAIAEMRPWIGEYISIAHFETIRRLKLIQLTDGFKDTRLFLEGIPKNKIDSIVWNQINNAFSEPVTDTDDTAEYIPTQIISEVIKDEGYDGIIYKSKVESGLNFSLFNIDDAKIIGTSLHQVKSIKVESEITPTY